VKEIDVLLTAPASAEMQKALSDSFVLHRLWDENDPEAFLLRAGPRIRGIARTFPAAVGRELIDRLPALEIIASYGVGYDSVDVGYASSRGIVVTNTPDVLTEEVADVAVALLVMTVRQLGAAERYLRAGRWPEADYPLTPLSLRDHTVGLVGLGRIGMAIARRLEAARIGIAYHNRKPRADVPYRYFGDLRELAAAVDSLMVVLPGGSGTHRMVNASVLDALGADGVPVNIGRGTTVEEEALSTALAEGRIRGAGLDVYMNEPNIDPRWLSLDNAVLLPHVGSASAHTRRAMGMLVVENLRSWFYDGKPLTPVPETPWPEAGQSLARPSAGSDSERQFALR
jgi:lactate dehydrogenase-like 2-hydroxyacid dehydrogenase